MIIDYNRGVELRRHRTTGMEVYMYVDEPGVYLNAHGKSVPESLAAEAGFPVDEYRKRRERTERLAQAAQIIDQDLGIERQTVAESGGYRIEDIGLGRHNVIDPDGNVLNKAPITREQADRLFTAMAPAPAAEAEVEAAPVLTLPSSAAKDEYYGGD